MHQEYPSDFLLQGSPQCLKDCARHSRGSRRDPQTQYVPPCRPGDEGPFDALPCLPPSYASVLIGKPLTSDRFLLECCASIDATRIDLNRSARSSLSAVRCTTQTLMIERISRPEVEKTSHIRTKVCFRSKADMQIDQNELNERSL